jgi:hypothetical protein
MHPVSSVVPVPVGNRAQVGAMAVVMSAGEAGHRQNEESKKNQQECLHV